METYIFLCRNTISDGGISLKKDLYTLNLK